MFTRKGFYIAAIGMVIFLLAVVFIDHDRIIWNSSIRENRIEKKEGKETAENLEEMDAKENDLQDLFTDIDKDENTMFTFQPLPEEIILKIRGTSWNEESPVSLEELSYVRVLHWGFDDRVHEGELIVHQRVAEEIVDIFKELFEEKFPIEKMRLIDEYGGNDSLSMADNNTSAYNFRMVFDGGEKLSKHSYGIAIDINPVQNPVIKGNIVLPVEGKNYVDRENVRKGMIVKEDACHRAFTNRGWTWGGDWFTLKDYQHFEKNITFK